MHSLVRCKVLAKEACSMPVPCTCDNSPISSFIATRLMLSKSSMLPTLFDKVNFITFIGEQLDYIDQTETEYRRSETTRSESTPWVREFLRVQLDVACC